jgi:hypothetical protein
MDLAPAPAAIEFGRFRVLPHRRGPLAAQWGSARLARWCRPTLAPDRLATAWTAKCPSFVARSLLANDRNRRISAFDGSRRRAANHPLCGRSLRGRNNRSWAACVPGIPSLRPRTTRRWQRPPGLPALPSALPINCCSCSRGGSGAALARHRPLPILRDGREPDSRPGRSRRWIFLTQKPRGLFAIPHRIAWLVVYGIAIARAKPKLAPYLAPFTRTAAYPVVPGSFAFRVWAEANPKRCWAVVLREA